MINEAKVYFDGSHYIAIPHTERERAYRPKRKEDEVEVVSTTEELTEKQEQSASAVKAEDTPILRAEETENFWDNDDEVITETTVPCPKRKRTATRKEIFEELYKKYIDLKKKERKSRIIEEMLPYFKDEESAVSFVERNMRRKNRNLIMRRIRLTRKVNLQEFNYFCTFTYDGEKHDEESFKKGLKTCFRNLCFRKGWKYVGVWERSPEKKRLHFHGMFYIPDGTMPGELIEKEDYNTTKHRRQTTVQNTYFNERFGRSDFECIDDRARLGEATAYIMKYIEKTGEKVVYSKGLPQFFVSDIKETDVITTMGMNGEKLLLFDDFRCYREGKLVGIVSADVIERLPNIP